MPKNPRTATVIAFCAIALQQAFAQSAQPAVPPVLLEHRSAFEGYRPFGQEEVQPWRQTNDTVRDAGGWRAYAREMHSPEMPTPEAPATDKPGAAGSALPPQSAQDPHAGHARP